MVDRNRASVSGRKRGRPKKPPPGPREPGAPVVKITTTELGKLKGIKPSSVAHMASPGKLLEPAKLEGGGFDRNHPAVIEWLNRPRGWYAAKKKQMQDDAAKQAAEAPRPTVEQAAQSQAQIYANRLGVTLDTLIAMPFGKVLEQFGTVDAVFGFAKTSKEIAYAKKAQVEIQERRGALVRREFVKRFIIGGVDGFHRRLLTDISPTIENKLSLAIKAGSSPEERRKIVHDLHSKALERAKLDMTNALNNTSSTPEEAIEDAEEKE